MLYLRIAAFFIIFGIVVPAASQKLKSGDLDFLLHAGNHAADSFLRKKTYLPAGKEVISNYQNYYYVSSIRAAGNRGVIRTVSITNVSDGEDSFHMLLYRIYDKAEYEELVNDFLSAGYTLSSRTGNDVLYKKENRSVACRISERHFNDKKTVMAYEFEMGR